MVSIQVDEQTAMALQTGAERSGLSLSEYLRLLVPHNAADARPLWDDIEHELTAASALGPALPRDFTRADIYDGHD